MTYFDTTQAKDFRSYRRKAKAQEIKIIDCFRSEGRPLSPSDVLRLAFDENTPLTSVRRAISVLTTGGWLRKTTIKVDGPYGRPEYQWTIVDPTKSSLLDFEGGLLNSRRIETNEETETGPAVN